MAREYWNPQTQQFQRTPPTRPGPTRTAAAEQDFDFSATEMLKNVPGSAWQLAKDVTAPIHSPVQTFTGLKDLAVGLYSKVTGGELPEEETANALGRFLADRYGSVDGFQRSFQEDPAGIVSDFAALLSGGGAAVAKIPGVASRPLLRKGVETLRKAGDYGDPLALARTAERFATGQIGKTGFPEQIYSSSAKFKPGSKGMTSQEHAQLTRTALDEGIPVTERGALRSADLRNQIAGEVNTLLDQAASSGTSAIPAGRLYAALEGVRNEYARVPGPASADRVAAVQGVIDKFQADMAARGRDYLTVKEVNDLKRQIYEENIALYRRGTDYGSPAAAKAETELAREARRAVAEEVPEVEALNKRYGQLAELQGPLEQATKRKQNLNTISPLALLTGGMAGGGGMLALDPSAGLPAAAIGVALPMAMRAAREPYALRATKKAREGAAKQLLSDPMLSTAITSSSAGLERAKRAEYDRLLRELTGE